MIKYCEAVLIAGGDKGKRCRSAGKLRSNARRLCWIHEQARLNPFRACPLRYVEEAKSK